MLQDLLLSRPWGWRHLLPWRLHPSRAQQTAGDGMNQLLLFLISFFWPVNLGGSGSSPHSSSVLLLFLCVNSVTHWTVSFWSPW